MSKPQCQPPLCVYNCCNKQGVCPTSASDCYKAKFADPIWIYVAIGLLVLLIVAGSITLLVVMKKRREKLALLPALQQNKEENPPPPQVNKKNIYVYEREANQNNNSGPKTIRPLSSSMGSSKQKKVRQKQPPRNPFENRGFLRNAIL